MINFITIASVISTCGLFVWAVITHDGVALVAIGSDISVYQSRMLGVTIASSDGAAA